MQLLFFDTFSHELPVAAGVSSAATTDHLNLDLVQFPSPVCVREVRVIPLGAKVHSNLPGGARMGATNPAKFELELFVNNLRAQGKCYQSIKATTKHVTKLDNIRSENNWIPIPLLIFLYFKFTFFLCVLVFDTVLYDSIVFYVTLHFKGIYIYLKPTY